jgi:hypothetical protein
MNANDKTDPEKLELLANWFDKKYNEKDGEGEIQNDLRRIALQLRHLYSILDDMCN